MVLLQRSLKPFFLTPIRERGSALYAGGAVTRLSGNQWKANAVVLGTRAYEVFLERFEDDIGADCDCPYFQSDGLCKHVWAALVAADSKNYLAGSPGSRPPKSIRQGVPDSFVEDDSPEDLLLDEDGEEEFHQNPSAFRPTPLPSPPADTKWQTALSTLRTPPPSYVRTPEWKRDREIYYVISGPRASLDGSLQLDIVSRDRLKNGSWGKPKSQGIERAVIPLIADPRDREILLMLKGAPDTYYYSGGLATSQYSLPPLLIRLLLPKLCETGRCLLRTQTNSPLEQMQVLTCDDGPPWQFRLHVEHKNNQWTVRGSFHRDDQRMEITEPSLLLEEGLVFAHGRIAGLQHSQSFAWITFLRQNGPIEVPVENGPDLVREMLSQPSLPPVAWPKELRFDETTATPRFGLTLQRSMYSWRRDILWAGLSFDYAGTVIPEKFDAAGVYDAGNRRFLVRDRAAERNAAERLLQLGLKRNGDHYPRDHPGWECSAKKLPKIIRELVRDGWHIESEGKLFRNANGFRAEVNSGVDWFELHGEVDFGSERLALPELLRALQHGDDMVLLGDGSYGMLPDEVKEKYGLLINLGKKQGNHLRFSRAQAGILDLLLAGREEVRVDDVFQRARTELAQFDGIAPADQPAGFNGRLRDYQLEGLAWMHFLRRFRFGGCLADDMGVGKTAQVLALLEMRRVLRSGANGPLGPSLAVVPRSLVYNWKREAERFTPKLRVLDYTGAGRPKNTSSFDHYDLIVTTYGTLRRDAASLQQVTFDYIILDEAQAIKNAASESSKAARLLNGEHRLALSGTPVENHLGELWSLFEFLNPGMLGGAAVFQIAGDTLRKPDQETRELLAKAIRPFILRRTKDQVARELPAKIEQTLYCELDAEQRKLYNELRDHYRGTLIHQVEREGIGRSRIRILEALLRLRQAACHPGLIDPKRARDPSAKLEALLPQISEVIEEGHKALVFSQFTSLLAIVRKELEASHFPYEYLDGKTRDREACVNRFNEDLDCRLFLVSLKAGGVGLNLSAADYVFLLDPWWNPAVEAQAIDRAHRIGQTKTVFAYRLIARDTVEEKVLELQKTKRDLADAIIRADARLVSNLNREDLQLLLS